MGWDGKGGMRNHDVAVSGTYVSLYVKKQKDGGQLGPQTTLVHGKRNGQMRGGGGEGVNALHVQQTITK